MSDCIILAGGGTGGHVYPLVAVGEALLRIAPELRLVFVGTERGIETRVVPSRGFELELVKVLPIRGFGARGVLRGTAQAFRSLPESHRLIRKLSPAAVLTVGGYAAGPVSLMARLSGIPVGLLEPNAVMGLANRLMAPLVQRGYTAFQPAERHFAKGRVLRTGVPIRQFFAPSDFVLTARPRRVLVLGGSQGARVLNEAVPSALAGIERHIEVRHQCGAKDVELVKERYRQARCFDADVLAFIDDMPQAIAWADLVISRSGASAVSEICAVGRPSLLVPYPFAAGNHQQVNAETVVQAGAARMLHNSQATSERLRAHVLSLLASDLELSQMASAARAYGKPMAARSLALDLLNLAKCRLSANLQDIIAVRLKENV